MLAKAYVLLTLIALQFQQIYFGFIISFKAFANVFISLNLQSRKFDLIISVYCYHQQLFLIFFNGS